MTENRLIPLSIPDLRGKEAVYLTRCVKENWVSSAGPSVTEFEEKIAALTGRAHAVATSNGTCAIQLALVALGVRPGDYVIVPDWSFAASANAVYHAGATPIFVDISAESWTLDPAQLRDALRHFSDKVRAVIVVDVLGHPAEMDELEVICDEAAVPLVEDAAGALGARYRGKPAGSFGTAATISFNGNKVLTTGGGGMVLFDDPKLAAKARHLSTQARVGENYDYDMIGFNFRMPNINAAIGLAQLERLEEMIKKRRQIASAYAECIAHRQDLIMMPQTDQATSNCWLSSVRLPSNDAAKSLVQYFRDRSIETRIFWSSLSRQLPYQTAPCHSYEMSQELSGKVVSLPSSSLLTNTDLARVTDALASWTLAG